MPDQRGCQINELAKFAIGKVGTSISNTDLHLRGLG